MVAIAAKAFASLVKTKAGRAKILEEDLLVEDLTKGTLVEVVVELVIVELRVLFHLAQILAKIS